MFLPEEIISFRLFIGLEGFQLVFTFRSSSEFAFGSPSKKISTWKLTENPPRQRKSLSLYFPGTKNTIVRACYASAVKRKQEVISLIHVLHWGCTGTFMHLRVQIVHAFLHACNFMCTFSCNFACTFVCIFACVQFHL